MYESLEDKIQHSGGAVSMLRQGSAGRYVFPFQAEYTNWRDEQNAWANSVVFFDQSFHMVDLYVSGPDVNRLFSEVGVNDFTGFGRNQAKQFVTVSPSGDYIGDGICFGVEDDCYNLVGAPLVPNWLEYNIATGDYDVDVFRDERSVRNPSVRKLFRFQVQGPFALLAIRSASGGTMPDIGFFKMADFTIAGVPVRALNHTMSGAPGLEHTGLEVTGDFALRDEVMAAIFAAGQEFGMRNGGALAYPSTCLESGWVPLPLPAIYSGDAMKPYRESLSADTMEANASLGGSFYSGCIEDHYYSPWDLGQGRMIKFNHDFIGKEALRMRADEPHLKKVRLEFNNTDVLRAIGNSLFNDDATRTKYFDLPYCAYTTFRADAVTVGDCVVGRSESTGYLATARKFVSIALVDEQYAEDGTELAVLWGNRDSSNPNIEKHSKAELRAVVNAKIYK